MSGTDSDTNSAQIAYWNTEAGPRWVAMQERMDAMLAPLMNAALDRARPRSERTSSISVAAAARRCLNSPAASARMAAWPASISRRPCSTAPANGCGTMRCRMFN